MKPSHSLRTVEEPLGVLLTSPACLTQSACHLRRYESLFTTTIWTLITFRPQSRESDLTFLISFLSILVFFILLFAYIYPSGHISFSVISVLPLSTFIVNNHPVFSLCWMVLSLHHLHLTPLDSMCGRESQLLPHCSGWGQSLHNSQTTSVHLCEHAGGERQAGKGHIQYLWSLCGINAFFSCPALLQYSRQLLVNACVGEIFSLQSSILHHLLLKHIH